MGTTTCCKEHHILEGDPVCHPSQPMESQSISRRQVTDQPTVVIRIIQETYGGGGKQEVSDHTYLGMSEDAHHTGTCFIQSTQCAHRMRLIF